MAAWKECRQVGPTFPGPVFGLALPVSSEGDPKSALVFVGYSEGETRDGGGVPEGSAFPTVSASDIGWAGPIEI